MLLHPTLIAVAGFSLKGALTSHAAPTVSDDAGCIGQTYFCYQAGGTASQEIIDEGVENLCKKYDGLDLSGRLQSAPDFYISPSGHHIGAEIARSDDVKPGCESDYHITYETCKSWLPTAYYACLGQQGGTVTDDRCGLQWRIDPDVTGFQDLSNATTYHQTCSGPPNPRSPRQAASLTFSKDVKVFSGEGIGNLSWPTTASHNSPAKRSPQLSYMGSWRNDGCYDSGYERNTADFMQAAVSFCNHYNFYLVQPGWALEYTYHMCYPDGMDHKMWLSLQIQEGSEPLCVEFSQCYLTFETFITQTCDANGGEDAAIKQGGWGVNNHGYAIIDGDPDVHNRGKAQEDIDCGDSKIIKELMAANAALSDKHVEYSCPI